MTKQGVAALVAVALMASAPGGGPPADASAAGPVDARRSLNVVILTIDNNARFTRQKPHHRILSLPDSANIHGRRAR